MSNEHGFAWRGASEEAEQATRRDLSIAFGLAVNAVFIGAFIGAFEVSLEPKQGWQEEPQITVVGVPPSPMPPSVEEIIPIEPIAVAPKVRVRPAAGTGPKGDPAKAVWAYLCNRDSAVGEIVDRACPQFTLIEPAQRPVKRVPSNDAVYGRQLATGDDVASDAVASDAAIDPTPARERLGSPFPWDERAAATNTDNR